jgi:hypothetical protein
LRYIIGISILLFIGRIDAQTLGGNSIFNFLKVPNCPQLTALGGVNVSQTGNDIGMAFNNPALLKPSMHSQMTAVFNRFYADIQTYHLALGYYNEKIQTNFLWGVFFFNYGSITETDASGNIFGKLRPTDWVMQVSASKKYLEKWNYGGTIKFINSNYGQYHSNGIAVDAGVLFSDSSRFLTASIVAKNMGFQLKKYIGTLPQDLPFDLQVGITKRLEKAPFGFSITAHHLHQFDIRYNDTTFNNENDFGSNGNKKFSLDKFFRHFVFAAQVYAGKYIEITAAYNHLRRQELNIGNSGNGVNGFSLGFGALLNKLQIRYARAYYQNNTSYNQFGINMKLNEYFGLGKVGEKIGW